VTRPEEIAAPEPMSDAELAWWLSRLQPPSSRYMDDASAARLIARADAITAERDRLLGEVERLTAERDTAYARGVEDAAQKIGDAAVSDEAADIACAVWFGQDGWDVTTDPKSREYFMSRMKAFVRAAVEHALVRALAPGGAT
jgi:hypothetical protein